MLGEHLLGIYEKAFDTLDSWETRLNKAKELGFDYLEISIDESDERLARLAWTAEQMEMLRRKSYDAHMPIRSMCLSAHRRFPFGSADPAVRAKAYALMERAITLADA
ncbi:MAG: TIM barrel protein, partial [Ruthenibacterium sp.]